MYLIISTLKIGGETFMKIKEGVILAGLHLSMRHALLTIDKVYKEHGQELVITSALDGEHSAGSLHYYGLALDIRTRYFALTEVPIVVNKLKEQLGCSYKVILEKTHIHIERRI